MMVKYLTLKVNVRGLNPFEDNFSPNFQMGHLR